MEERKSRWLSNEELEWKQKSRALWIQAGDNNTKYFQQFANLRRNQNSIWEIKDEEGRRVNSFQDKMKLVQGSLKTFSGLQQVSRSKRHLKWSPSFPLSSWKK
jgi:hypothetical protein